MEPQALDPLFAELRPKLVGIAYRMMGTLGDAEEAVQDAYVRLRAADAEGLDHPDRYLTRAVVNQCLDRWKSARAQRETYIGPWLPEPILDETADDPALSGERHDSLSVAFLVLLESLNPVERAVFLLHDVFGYDFEEVAEIVDKTAVHCRQIARRARGEIQRRRPRFERDPLQHRRLVDEFLAACNSGDLERLRSLLADDVELYSDGGGKMPAARVPILGQARVLDLFAGLAKKYTRLQVAFAMAPRTVNGRPGAVLVLDGQAYGVLSLETDAARIRRVYLVSNPDKAAALRTGPDAAGGA